MAGNTAEAAEAMSVRTVVIGSTQACGRLQGSFVIDACRMAVCSCILQPSVSIHDSEMACMDNVGE
jgi:hypothetical protein